ncbi:MAG: universal stress protein [Proteobacteria bacterium]|nr:universal stress protein [Pseudomonadota bacterium]
MKLNKILCPIDFSEYSEKAVSYAKELAKTFNSKLYIMHVIYEPAEFTGFYVPHISFDKIKTEIKSGAQKLMDDFISKNLKDFSNYEVIVTLGDPAEEIVKFSDEKEIDLIVIGSQGKKGLEKVVFGSTAEKVVKRANCPVMCIKPSRE